MRGSRRRFKARFFKKVYSSHYQQQRLNRIHQETTPAYINQKRINEDMQNYNICMFFDKLRFLAVKLQKTKNRVSVYDKTIRYSGCIQTDEYIKRSSQKTNSTRHFESKEEK